MADKLKFTIDGVEVAAEPGQTILDAADAAGIYIPRLCAHPDLKPIGSCRVCTVIIDGRPLVDSATMFETLDDGQEQTGGD